MVATGFDAAGGPAVVVAADVAVADVVVAVAAAAFADDCDDHDAVAVAYDGYDAASVAAFDYGGSDVNYESDADDDGDADVAVVGHDYDDGYLNGCGHVGVDVGHAAAAVEDDGESDAVDVFAVVVAVVVDDANVIVVAGVHRRFQLRYVAVVVEHYC